MNRLYIKYGWKGTSSQEAVRAAKFENIGQQSLINNLPDTVHLWVKTALDMYL